MHRDGSVVSGGGWGSLGRVDRSMVGQRQETKRRFGKLTLQKAVLEWDVGERDTLNLPQRVLRQDSCGCKHYMYKKDPLTLK